MDFEAQVKLEEAMNMICNKADPGSQEYNGKRMVGKQLLRELAMFGKIEGINELDSAGRSALGRAVEFGDVGLAKYLRNHGADPHKVGDLGFKQTPAQMALAKDDPAVRAALLTAIGVNEPSVGAPANNGQKLKM